MATLNNIDLQSATAPVNLVADAALTVGSTYQFQHLGGASIRLAEAAATPDGDGHILLPKLGDSIQMSVAAGEGIWAWVDSEDGATAKIGITEVA